MRIMNKRGDVSQVEDIVGFLYKIGIIIVTFVLIFLLLRSAIVANVDIFEAEANVLAFRLVYQKGAMSYYDPDIDRVYPGIIDLNAFNSIDLDSVINFENPEHAAAEVVVVSQDGHTWGPVYMNELYFDRWLPIARSGGEGAGAVRSIEKTFYVLLKDEKEVAEKGLELMDNWDPRRQDIVDTLDDDFEGRQLVPGKMTIKILIPNT